MFEQTSISDTNVALDELEYLLHALESAHLTPEERACMYRRSAVLLGLCRRAVVEAVKASTPEECEPA
jgi:hypothetical protein